VQIPVEEKWKYIYKFNAQGDWVIEEIWKRILDEQYKYQGHAAAGGQWEHFDVIKGRGQKN